MAKVLRSKLKAAFENAKIQKANITELRDVSYGPGGLSFSKLLSLDHPVVREATAEVALRSSETDQGDAALLCAFEAAGLDHRDPFDWRLLLQAFADADFGPPSKKPKTSNLKLYFGLILDCHHVWEKNPDFNNSEVCKYLRRHSPYKAKYEDYSHDGLRKLLRQALKPENNPLVRYPEMEDPVLRLMRSAWESTGKSWSPEVEERLTSLKPKILELSKQRK